MACTAAPGSNAARAALARAGLLGGGRRKAAQLLRNRIYRDSEPRSATAVGRSTAVTDR